MSFNNTLIPLEVLSGQFIYNFSSNGTNINSNNIHYNSASHILRVHVEDNNGKDNRSLFSSIKNNINHIYFFGENNKATFIFNASYLTSSDTFYSFSGSFIDNNGEENVPTNSKYNVDFILTKGISTSNNISFNGSKVNGNILTYGDDNNIMINNAININSSGITTNGNLTVHGDFQVNGSNAIINTENKYIIDPLLELNSSLTLPFSGNTGILMKYNASNSAFMGWNNSTSKIEFGIGELPPNSTGNLNYTLADINASSASFQSISTNDIYSSNASITNLSSLSGSHITLSLSIIPNACNTYDLGSAGKPFRELYLSGSSVHFGGAVISFNGSNIRLEYDNSPIQLNASSMPSGAKGATGDKGLQGDKGDTGPSGPSGSYSVHGSHFNSTHANGQGHQLAAHGNHGRHHDSDHIKITSTGKYIIHYSFHWRQNSGGAYYRLHVNLMKENASGTKTKLFHLGSSNGLTSTDYWSSGYYPFGYYRGRYGWVSESGFHIDDNTLNEGDKIYLEYLQYNATTYPIYTRHVKVYAIPHDDLIPQDGSLNK